MFEQRVSGSYYEMGLQIGKQLKQVRIEIEEYTNEPYPPTFSPEKLELARKFEEEYQKYTPELLEEMKGIADGSGLDYNTLLAYEFTPYRLQPSCLVMAISAEHTQNGFPVLAKSQEWVEEDSKFLTLCYTKPNNKLGSLGVTFAGITTSRCGGMNDAGLALSSVSASFNTSNPGVMSNVATRWILDNCRTTDEAVAFLRKIPKTWGGVYLIIDKHNHIAKVEAHPEETKITKIENGFGYATLMFDSPEMKKYNSLDEYTNDYYPRADFLNNWFEHHKGKITENLMIEALKDHEHSMCIHTPFAYGNKGICWSYILTIGKDDALICEGPPCKNEFKKYAIR